MIGDHVAIIAPALLLTGMKKIDRISILVEYKLQIQNRKLS
jgi:hypothetical protein